jgi:hypothetical protein
VIELVDFSTSGIIHWWISETELLKMEKRGQFPDETVRIIVSCTM